MSNIKQSFRNLSTLALATLFLLSLTAAAATAQPDALYLDGVDDYVSLGYPVLPHNSGSDPWTVEFWLNTTTPQHDTAFSQYATSTNRRFELKIHNVVKLWKKASGTFAVGTTPVIDGAWHHLAAVKHGPGAGQVQLYIDGNLEAVGQDAAAMAAVATEIGRINNGSTPRWLPGAIDDLRIWGIPRTQQEIMDNMNSTLSGSEPGLLAYYKFDGDFSDSGPNGFHGTPFGGPGFGAGAPLSSATPLSYTWNGSCTSPSQVGANGSVQIDKTPAAGGGYDVVMEGQLAINSPTYGYVRHKMLPGLLPSTPGAPGFSCEIQNHATKGDASGVGNYGGQGVHLRDDSFAGYADAAIIWFPEKFWNGTFTLRCVWHTDEEHDLGAINACPGANLL